MTTYTQPYAKFIEQSGLDTLNGLAPAINAGADGGLVVAQSPSGPSAAFTAAMTQRLSDWLTGLRLLENVPLDYLVPDAALLPAESIRFFFIDPTWVDRIVDGVFAAADVSSIDSAFSASMLATVRQTLDASLVDMANAPVDGVSPVPWSPTDGLTGMLIRSELVRRWPDMIVRAYATADTSRPRAVLRVATLSKNVLIAVFAGTPDLVTLREPHVGVRFGVERKDDGKPIDPNDTLAPGAEIVLRDTSGAELAGPVHVPVGYLSKSAGLRVVDVKKLVDDATTGIKAAGSQTRLDLLGERPRLAAVELMRPSFVQRFAVGTAVERGFTGSMPGLLKPGLLG